MNRIGIITFCDNTNYGSFLQTFALYKAIEELGLQVELIDYRKNVPDYERITINGFLRVIKKNGWERGLKLSKNIYRMQHEFDRMIKHNMKKSRIYRNKTINQCQNYSTYVVGSDLVWDKRYALDYTYMLDFVNGTSRKVAYAASYGYEIIPDEEKNAYKKNLSMFDNISVREKNVQKELSNLLDRNIYHVCDPTMLMTNQYWISLVGERLVSYDYVFVYLPDSKMEILKAAKRYARKHRFKVFFVDKSDEKFCPWNPLEFINLIYYSSKVFTASYHGLLFALYFEKELAFVKGKPSNRLDTISKILSIEEFNIKAESYNPERKMNYVKEKKLEETFRQKSKKILREMMINDCAQ